MCVCAHTCVVCHDSGISGTFRYLGIQFSSQTALISVSSCVCVLWWCRSCASPYLGRDASLMPTVDSQSPPACFSGSHGLPALCSCLWIAGGPRLLQFLCFSSPATGEARPGGGCSSTTRHEFRSLEVGFYCYLQCCLMRKIRFRGLCQRQKTR